LTYKVAFKKSAARDLKKIGTEQAVRILEKIEADLPSKAESFPMLSGKFAGLRKFRIGDYRVVFTILEDTILILRIGHRREVYR
jgi:mRNA interferase RelE/StbE